MSEEEIGSSTGNFHAESSVKPLPVGFTARASVDDDAASRETSQADDIEAARAPFTIEASVASKIGFATQQNDLPLLNGLVVRNNTGEPAENLVLVMRAEPTILAERRWTIDRIAADGEVHLRDRRVSLSGGMLADLTERMRSDVTFTLMADETALATSTHRVTALAHNEWGGAVSMPELLAAFICPNESAVARVLKDAARALEAAGKTAALEGYQGRSRTRVWEIAAAIWSAIASRRLTYAEPPASFERDGQKVRLPAEIETTGLATCLDTTLLFAAALEQAGLNPVVAFTRGHAFCGVWLQPQTFPGLLVDEASELRKAIDQNDLLLFETTLATAAHAVPFSKAAREAARQIAEDVEGEFVYALDIKQARGRQISPLASLSTLKDATATPDAADGILPLDTPPELPGFDFGLDDIPPPETPVARIEAWKRQLLDLTKRNRLLNLKPSSTVIPIFCPDPGRLEDHLAEGKTLRFTTPPEPAEGGKDRTLHLYRTGDDLAEGQARAALERDELVANIDRRTLDAALVNLYRKARSDIEEGGANTLFLALGMLRWRPAGETKLSYRAPLVMLPVRLERRSAKAQPYLARHDDDAVMNMTLLEMLRQEFDITIPELAGALPEDHAGIDLARIWAIVRHKVRDTPGFEVVTDVCLSTFSFAKFLMWKDLADRTEQLKTTPFVRHMIDTPREPYGGGARFLHPRDIDTTISPGEIFAPFNADSSQIVAIHASGKDGDFVLEGPPGTGKSETICNIITHNIALGRRVLFVAEKQAALSVVRRRMDDRGLGRFCLDLHANHANKKAVLDQLHRSWQAAEEHAEADWHTKAAELERVRDALNVLATCLHRKGRTGISARDAIGRAVRYGDIHPVSLDWGGDLARDDRAGDEAGLAALDELARRLGQAFGEITPEDRALFAVIETGAWSHAWVARMTDGARRLNLEIGSLRAAVVAFCEAFGLSAPREDTASVAAMAAVAEAVVAAGAANLGFALDAGGRAITDHLGRALLELNEYRTLKQKGAIALMADSAIASAPVAAWAAERDAAAARSWPMRPLAMRRLRKTMAAHLGLAKPAGLESSLATLGTLQKTLSRMDGHAAELPAGTPWRGLDTDIARAGDLLARGVALRDAVMRLGEVGWDPIETRERFRRLFAEGYDLLEPGMPAAEAAAGLQAAHAAYATARDTLLAAAEASGRSQSPEQLEQLCAGIGARASRLNAWCGWVGVRREAVEAGLGVIAAALEDGVIAAEQTRDAFRTAYCRWLAPLMIDAEPALRTFSAVAHEDLIRTFRLLDKELAETTADFIRATMSGKVPSSTATTTPAGFGVLRREIARKSRHKPVRNLIAEMGDALLTLTPCVMMSPLSVAQFLPADTALFDLVVFDEASQITVADAIGAIARGKRVIVVGDPKQMPPTSFFDKAAGDEGDEDTKDLESILDEAIAASAPQHRLTGHYRSRHESLIAFSNHAYYDSSLVTYPSADTRESAVTLRLVDGIYAKGKARTNAVEAKAIVEEVVRRLRDPAHAGQSIGVVTLNAEQQKLILDLLDQERRADPELEPFFADDTEDPVFVKNLETVQGDQRDVILLGITYGPTEPGARTMSMNFGPLNKPGGERRLNVAITRATTEVVVFASFDPTMIDRSRTSARAMHDLRDYLDFAARGPVALGEAIVSIGGYTAYDSEFEMAVAEGLRRRGWDVRTQIGASRFRIDLGIVDPDMPGRFLAGVECDGATYHSSPSARDRDRVRHAVLERLGWRLLRVWSTDYFIDPAARLDRLDADLRRFLETVRHGRQAEAPPLPPASEIVTHLAPPTPDSLWHPKVDEAERDAKPPDEDDVATVCDDESPRWQPAARAPVTPAQEHVETEGDGREEAPAQTMPAGDPALFHEDSYQPHLARMAQAVIDLEGPVRFDRLVAQVARAHGFQRAGNQIRQRVSAAIGKSRIATKDACDELVFWPQGQVPEPIIPFRGLVFDGIERGWREVPDAEMLHLARTIAAENHTSPGRAMAERLGLRRLATSTKDELEALVMRSITMKGSVHGDDNEV